MQGENDVSKIMQLQSYLCTTATLEKGKVIVIYMVTAIYRSTLQKI